VIRSIEFMCELPFLDVTPSPPSVSHELALTCTSRYALIRRTDNVIGESPTARLGLGHGFQVRETLLPSTNHPNTATGERTEPLSVKAKA
jgi:hypothetical protein